MSAFTRRRFSTSSGDTATPDDTISVEMLLPRRHAVHRLEVPDRHEQFRVRTEPSTAKGKRSKVRPVTHARTPRR